MGTCLPSDKLFTGREQLRCDWDTPAMRRLSRSILADKPRVTRFPVEFDSVEPAPALAGGEPADAAPFMQNDENALQQVQEAPSMGIEAPMHEMQLVDMEA